MSAPHSYKYYCPLINWLLATWLLTSPSSSWLTSIALWQTGSLRTSHRLYSPRVSTSWSISFRDKMIGWGSNEPVQTSHHSSMIRCFARSAVNTAMTSNQGTEWNEFSSASYPANTTCLLNYQSPPRFPLCGTTVPQRPPRVSVAHYFSIGLFGLLNIEGTIDCIGYTKDLTI